MGTVSRPRRRLLTLGAAPWAWLGAAPSVWAHASAVGDIRIDHPYALPTPEGARNGAVYLRALINRGEVADQLVAASTPVAASVEFHRSEIDAQQVMRMRVWPALELPARSELPLRHDGLWHLMLRELKAPLRLGQRFPMTLRFARAGEREVSVWVQQPRVAAQADHGH